MTTFTGAPTLPALAAAYDHLLRAALDQGFVPASGTQRYVLHPHHVDLAVRVEAASWPAPDAQP